MLDERKLNFEDVNKFMGYVRELRSLVFDLQDHLTELEQNFSIADAGNRAQEIEHTLKKQIDWDILNKRKQKMEAKLDEIRNLLNSDPLLFGQVAEEITNISNFWDRVLENWPRYLSGEPVNPEELKNSINKSKTQINSIIQHVGYLTIPNRLNSLLAQMRVGQCLDFNQEFQNELPQKEQREAMLRYLNNSRYLINGVIQVQQGCVMRASRSFKRKLLSFSLMLLALGIGFGIAQMAGNLKKWGLDWTLPASSKDLMVAYAWVVLGAFLHFMVEIKKKIDDGTLVVLGDWTAWIHAKETSIIGGIIILWFIPILLSFAVSKIDGMTAVLAGYSADSIFGLFLKRFSQDLTTRTAALKQQLGLTGS